ncbi:MAG: hypothetical protein COW00_14760 [Bdellovibrio sp. CG12_big_fil_rev_8_21_14_0_65_39_13]|nr:MAG: hypothetical protein COW78_13990 [Bdellovibrio sp. CG22_combo_CG10-13_8_21_14_all_39_27]PIQ58556.1 MAG: hypothetical protein COW00_14760 [Bdellovibrio sp. CG12_big_fil_rev_8_21_14_0_65_39_13]PIR32461.1 MAG: hypothetical protein COV37_19845 [Bdellovibrio sp. CG11_big_fil_rev_8_21_14_0_20_39_38]
MPLKSFKIAIPLLNEAESLVASLPSLSQELKKQIIFIDNGSIDETHELLEKHDCFYLAEKQKGYGSACYKVQEYALQNEINYLLYCDIEDLSHLTCIIHKFTDSNFENYDFVYTRRIKYRGAFHAYLGTQLIVHLSKWMFDRNLPSDLGPVRMVKVKSLASLNMEDRYFGWTLEMQLRSFKHKMSFKEIEIDHSIRIYGQSKISGSARGRIKAAYYLIKVLCKNSSFFS